MNKMKVFRSFPLLAFCLMALLAVSTADTKVKSQNKGDHRIMEDKPSAKESLRERFMGANGMVSYDRIRVQEESNLKKFRKLLKKNEQELMDHESGEKPLDENKVILTKRRIDEFKKYIENIDLMTEEEYEEYLLNKVRTFGEVRQLKINPEL